MSAETGRCVLELRAANHSGVNAIAWSPDDRRLASAWDDRALRVWEVETGKEQQRLDGHTGRVWAACWSPDGHWLASGSDDRTVRIWDAETGRERSRLEGHTDIVFSVCWSPDGRWLASGSDDRQVRIWDAVSGQERRRLDGHTGAVESVSWSPDSRLLASGSADHSVRIWETDSGAVRQRLDGHGGLVCSVCWSPDGRSLASGCSDSAVRIWDTDSGHVRRRLAGHIGSVDAVSWSWDGRRLVSGSFDQSVRIWDADSGKELRRLEGHTGRVSSVCWSPDGSWLASGSNDRTVRIWALAERASRSAGGEGLEAYVARQAATVGRAKGRAIAALWVPNLREAEGDCLGVLRGSGAEGNEGLAPGLALLPGRHRLATCSPDRSVRVWDLASGAELWKRTSDRNADIASSPDGRWLASASVDCTVWVWDAESGQERRRLAGHTDEVFSVAWAPDGRWLASGSKDRTVRIWDAEEGLERHRLEGHTGWAESLSWSPDGHWLASGSYDHTVRIWDPDSGEERRCLEGHTKRVRSVSWSPDGRALASGAFDHTVRVWDARSGEMRRLLAGHTDEVFSVAWAPDGRWLASGSNDRTVRIWDADSGQEMARFKCEEMYANRLLWAPDGAFLASSHWVDSFRFWDTRRFAASRRAPVNSSPPPPEFGALPAALATLQGMGLQTPLSLLRDLLRLTAGQAVDGPAAAFAGLPGPRKLAALQWPTAARVGLVAWLLRRVPMQGWAPPPGLDPAQLREQLAAAIAGEAITQQAPHPPLAPLQQSFAGVDDRFLTLLAMLGPQAVAADPALILRLSRKLPALPPHAESQRRLLGLRLDLDGDGFAQGQGPGSERAGVQRRGDLRSLVPSQLALPEAVLQARQARGELLYRARAGREPPRLRPVVLLLDVSPASFGPVEAITRLAAYVLASTLRQARLPAWLVTAGGAGTASLLEQPADLVEIWSRRTLEPARPARAASSRRRAACEPYLVGQEKRAALSR